MKILDDKTQMIAVEKVLEEMQKAEEYVKNWNACWYEQLLDAYCLSFHYEIGETNVRDIERKYEPRYKLANAFYSGDSIGIPLVKETLVGDNSLTGETNINFECQFGRIDWYGMSSHKSTRHFSFNNNGVIEFSKAMKACKKQTLQHPNRISYDTSFNVLSNGFDISITLDHLTEDWREKYKYDYFTFSLKDTILQEKFNDVEITRDLCTGIGVVKITKNKQNDENIIAKNLSEKIISSDNFDFNVDAVQQTEARIIEMVKCIRGELPLFGLVERIDNCLNLIDKEKYLNPTAKPKTLKLELSNN